MKKKSGSRVALIVLCVVLGLILTALIGGTIYANHLMGLVNRMDNQEEPTLSQEELDKLFEDEKQDPDETAPTVNAEDIDWGDENVDIINTSDNVINIMLIGQDERVGNERSRSDTMILVTINKAKKTITLTSFLRDLYVKIPGYLDNKMNAAYRVGGLELLDKVLEVNFGVQVDGHVVVDFTQFPQVIELLGGVDMELRADEAAYINQRVPGSELTKGAMHLNGDQALVYSRIRKLDADADFSRTNRQRKVINSLINQLRDSKLTTLMGLLDDVLPMISTDMSNGKIIGYATDIFPILADCTVVSQRVPADGAYYLASINNLSCIVADMNAARQLLAETIGE